MENKRINMVAMFEKVSYEQFKKDLTEGENTILTILHLKRYTTISNYLEEQQKALPDMTSFYHTLHLYLQQVGTLEYVQV